MPEKKGSNYEEKTGFSIKPEERELLTRAAYKERDAALRAPRLKVENNAITYDHPDRLVGRLLLQEALGGDRDFAEGLINQLANATTDEAGSLDSRLNFLVSVVKSIKPKDPMEAMLAAQMAIVHMCALTAGGRFSGSGSIQHHDSADRAFNKLTRTYVAQMDALKRYRDVEARPVNEQLPVTDTASGDQPSAAAAPPSTRPADSQLVKQTLRRVVPMKRVAR